MFHADMTFTLALIALVAGAFLVFSTKIHKEVAAFACKVVGYIVVILAIVMLLLSGYGMVKGCAMKRRMKTHMMQQGKMMPMPMMHNMMKGKMPMQNAMPQPE